MASALLSAAVLYQQSYEDPVGTSFHVSFLSGVKMNSINWSAPNIWVFIAQLVQHCSANAEAMGSNPVEALKIFFGQKFAIAITTAMTTSPLSFVFPQFKSTSLVYVSSQNKT